MSTELIENISFPSLLEQYDQKLSLYKMFASEVEHLIKSILHAKGIKYNAITSRVKERTSVSEKITRKNGKYATLAEMTDVVGLRIITYYSADVDVIADIIEQEFIIDRENSIDKRESLEPDRFGYCSVHYVVSMNEDRLKLCEFSAFAGMRCEIQIRSILQHAWAEIEHDIGYKSDITIPRTMRRDFSRIAGLLEMADKEFVNIQTSLQKYKQSVREQFSQSIIPSCEIDAVILESLINQNIQIMMLNSHISALMKRPLEAKLTDYDYKSTIEELNWFGITTTDQLLELIANQTDRATAFSSEFLKGYITDDEHKYIAKTIAFFYLCYALLLSKDCSLEKIKTYLRENHIGLWEQQDEFAEEIYLVGQKLETSDIPNSSSVSDQI